MSVFPSTDLLQEALGLHRCGAVAEAAARYVEVLRADPANADAYYYLGIISWQHGRFVEGAELARKSLASDPRHARAHVLLGRALTALGRREEALASFERAISLAPDLAQAHGIRGDVLCELKRFNEALAAFEKALALNPSLARAWLGCGNVFAKLKRYGEAHAAYDKALALNPNLAEAWLGCGNVFARYKRYGEAHAAYDKALALNPNLAEAWLGCGNVFARYKRYGEALAAYDKALALKPDLYQVSTGRGTVLTQLEQYDNAFAAYDRALALKPDFVDAWLGRGNLLTKLKQYDGAFAAYDRAVALEPDLSYVAGARLFSKLAICDWTDLQAEVAELLAAIRERKPSSAPFTILALPSSAADQLQCARRYVQDQPTFPQIWRGEVYSHDRIRIAYLSADLYEHPMAYLLAGLFEQHDKLRFEVTGISFGPCQNSTVQHRIKSSFERFVDGQHKSDQNIAELIWQLEIDIAVDLNGFTADNRLNILARRAAPIQVNYLGYPGTMGASYIDYVLADATIIPENQRAFYAEQVVWLPECYQVNDDRRRISEYTPTRRECGLPDTAFVFCCFNNPYKIMPDMFDIWMRLLRTTEDSVLWLFGGNSTASVNLRREAEKRGVSPQRLIFAAGTSLPDHLARHRLADLFLDTLPYNAHTTASDALWVGFPVLTCLGTTFVGRVAASLLKAIGLDELITRSLEEYEALALKLARDPSFLVSLKDRLAQNRNTRPLFDTERSTRHIESAYIMMWERYQRGEMSEAFAVDQISARSD